MSVNLTGHMHLYITYEDVFRTPPPEDRISLIEKFKKKDLLAILALINLHPSRDAVYHHLEWDKQVEVLCKICAPDRELFLELIQKIDGYNKFLLQKGAAGILFSRVANIVAINEILQSNRIQDESEETLDARKLIEYYLSINSFIRNEQDKYSSQKRMFLEYCLVMAVYNEYNTPFFAWLELFRGVELINFMQNDPDLGDNFKAYFAALGVEPYLYFSLAFSFVIPTRKKEEDALPSFKPTNRLVENVIMTMTGQDIVPTNPIEALNLKINNFYPLGNNVWLLLDESFLVDHCFYYTINSFWFSHMKQTGYSHKSYFGKIGRFYETYIAKLIMSAFHYLENPSPKVLDDLKIRNPEEIEVADIYFRENENIFIAEIKSTSYGVNFKYAADVIAAFEQSKDRFIKDFGLFQVLKAIKFISEHHNIIDNNEQDIKEFHVYPTVIFNERLFQTPFSNLFFQNLFLDFFTGIVGEFKRPMNPSEPILFGNFIIHPLTLIHTTELEILEPILANKQANIWELLTSHHRAWELQIPLYQTVLQQNPYDLAEYAFQRVKPILAEYDRKRKETLGE